MATTLGVAHRIAAFPQITYAERNSDDHRITVYSRSAVAAGEAPATVTDAQRAQAAADVACWKADALVLPKTGFSSDVLAAVTNLYGTLRGVDDVWLWQIRH